MSDKIDMSLDDIIVPVDNRGESGSRHRRSGGIGPMRYRDGRVRRSNRPVPYSRSRDIAHQRDHRGRIDGTKVFLSNLHSGYSGEDIEDLFSRFGRVREGTVHYDRSGEPLGTGTLTFERRADAIEAMQRQDDVSPERRVATMEILADTPASRGTGQNRRGSASRGARGLRGGRRGRGGPTPTRRTPTAQELDAEMDAYFARCKRFGSSA